MEEYIPISFLNDFIFCPRSIYFHQLYGRADTRLYQGTDQVAGTIAHKSIDSKSYSTSKNILQTIDVYSSRFNIAGKIDIFDIAKKVLTERKRKIKRIYDGYIYQLYAQYFALIEMGYDVEFLKLYSMEDNKSYPIDLPQHNQKYYEGFLKLLEKIRAFRFDAPFIPNPNKCHRCIYNNLCDVAC